MNYLYIFGTILLTVYCQIVLKWRIGIYGKLPDDILQRLFFLIRLVFDPFIFSGLVGAFIAALLWMAAMTKFDLSYAYPFVGLTFVLVFLFSAILFKEPVTVYKIIGMLLIVMGVYISSRSL